MREEESPKHARSKAARFADQNQVPKAASARGGPLGYSSKLRTAASSKKSPLSGADTNRAHPPARKQLPGAGSKAACANRAKPSGSCDLILELNNLRSLLRESKERESKLQAEVLEARRSSRVSELEREVQEFEQRLSSLEAEKKSLCEQLALLNSDSKGHDLEMEVFELRRLNKELQLQKRDLACRLSSIEKVAECDMISKMKAEASLLKHTNEDLCKQVEDLQMNRMNEVEELVYLRWLNSWLRNELHSCKTMDHDKTCCRPSSIEMANESPTFLPCQSNELLDCFSAKRLRNKFQWPIIGEDSPHTDAVDRISSGRRQSINGPECSAQDCRQSKRRQSDSDVGFMCPKDEGKDLEQLTSKIYDLGVIQRAQLFGNCQESNKTAASPDIKKRAVRIPNPPPRPSGALSSSPKGVNLAANPAPLPPPPPPPPPKFTLKNGTGTVRRAPQVVEFYHSLMKRDSKKDPSNGGIYDSPDVTNVRNSMIGEIENRSSHLLAIKADVETQGEFVNSLIREVNEAIYQDIEDVVTFVKWLDDELCFLVDERAVLKHFDWPEKKADTLREVAFGYRDLKKLESDISHYEDNPRLPCDIALKKMVTLSEKMERTVYNLLRTRDPLMRHCKEFQIPTDWMLDNGMLSKIKFGSMKLAKKYIKRVAMELQCKGALEKDPAMDYMLLQGVRFAFRIHQFAGGFDAETMLVFEELRNLAHLLNKA